MTLDEARAHIGSIAIYRPSYPGARAEQGVITDVRITVRPGKPTEGLVFVRYGSDYGSKATRPEDLTLLADEVRR